MSTSHIPLSRLLQIRRVIKKHGLSELLMQLSLSKKAEFGVKLLFGNQTVDGSRGERIRNALEELGPVFVKLGQALSTRPDLLPADIALELTKLQDQVPPFSGEQAISIIKQRYGDETDDVFETVDGEPMASASVAQVHSATLKKGLALEGKNGKQSYDVIIKVIRPGIEKVIDSDLRVMYSFAKILQKHWIRGELMKPVDIIKEYDMVIHDELDLRREAANCCQMGFNFQDTDLIYVPQVYWDYTHKNVMVMERINGTSIREIDTLSEQGVDLKQLAEDGVAVFFKQAFEDNFFHADMHPGNIFVSEAGKWIAIDFGIMGTLTDKDKQFLAEIFLAFFRRDYASIAEVYHRAGWIPKTVRASDFETAIRTVCEPNFAKPISEMSFGTVLLQVFETARRFEMPVQPQLVLLYKTLLNIEGLGRQLYPQLNLWDTAQPFLEEWMKQQTSPEHFVEVVKKDWFKWQSIIPEIPEYLRLQIENNKQGGHEQQKLQLLEEQQSKTHLVRFHQIFGFGTALASLAIYLLSANQLLLASTLTNIAPISGVLGLAWAYWHSRK